MNLQLTEKQLVQFINQIVEQMEESTPKLLDVPHYLQSDDSTCGPASLRMVFAYYGVNLSEEDIADACNHTYELGCKSEDMACAAEALGFNVLLKNNSTIDEVERLVKVGVPVIVDWFCGDPPEGHSSVVIGVDKKNMYILDPYLEEMRVVAKEDFRRCWFDFYETPITPQNLYVGQIIVIRPKKNKSENKSLRESINDSVDAVLVGGLDYRPSDYPISQQVEILKRGLGSNKNVKGFRYNTSTSEILNFLSQNPKVPIFLFSAGARKAEELSNSNYVDLNKLFIIEPFAASSGTKSIVRAAVSNGVPASNVFVGGSSGRGQGVVDGASSSQSDSHWGALTNVGKMKSGVSTSSITSSPISKQGKVVSSTEQDKPSNVKEFQTWLDKNHAGWHRKYGKLNDDIEKGWGIFGPNTKRAWTNIEWRKEFLNKEKK